MSDLLIGCRDKEKRTSEAISALIDRVAAASKSDDPEKMKSVLSDLKKSLADMKADHDKSSEMMSNLEQRIQNLKKQIKISKEEHKKVGDMIEDESMDDVIWAY